MDRPHPYFMRPGWVSACQATSGPQLVVLVFGDSDLVSLIGRLADLHSGKWFLILMISKVWAQRERFLLSKGVLLGPPVPSTLCRFSLPYSQHVSMSRRVIGLRSSLLLSCCHPWCIRSDS